MNDAPPAVERLIVPDGAALTAAALERVRGWLLEAIQTKGRAVMALAGGKTPEHFYKELGNMDLPWENVLLLLGDERIAPGQEALSNAAMIRRSLMAGGRACMARFLAPELEGCSPQDAAHAYEADIARALGVAVGGDLVLDVVILGLGKDGHTASLFPGSPALMAQKAWIFAVPAPEVEPRVPRLTMTLPLISRARRVLFLAGGEEKLALAQRIWAEGGTMDAPAAKACPGDNCVWIISRRL
ncbi:6-phosphogluconolactonase [Megalodesulfovibrio gigas]|uniref:6-phosphogluconolactonase n=1 Tax=Megalodesulfovibrio gigas (strain ATCC 19364 / DSM 1382 / NCIMB 9332 / VKM B-1759) TaxID=1121448 RepID=T2GBE9_MEGG1|nr:6-phosphogluconolactonase [Megalodesulfovibrio gigas]AGW13232.1 putative 6-phosphogluconolactonase [Megalodesulfovibrio gigas DSM 1382 = ATCC 19364]